MRIVVKLLTTITIVFVFAMTSWFILYENQPSVVEWEIPAFDLQPDTETGTLTVTDINLNFNWDEITIGRGKATLPSGKVSPGDIITNCYGTLELYTPGSSLLGSWVFNEAPDEIEEIRFLGDWEGSDRTVSFSSSGYTNYYFDFGDDDTDGKGDHKEKIDEGDSLTIGADVKLAITTYGEYETQIQQLVVFDVAIESIPVNYNVTFYDQDSRMKLVDPTNGYSWEFNRTFTPSLYVTILNASEKLDECLRSFVNNISNQTYNDTLANGLNVSVSFEEELTEEEIENITQQGLVFLNDSDGNATHDESVYSVKIDALHDLYYLASKSDVEEMVANDTKFYDFGCTELSTE